MNKVLVIGIDSLAPVLLSAFEKDLPNFTRLRQASPDIKLKSIFPVDSIPAWTTIHTGLNPAKHGLVYVFDVFKTSWQDILGIDTSVFKGKTFWDYASREGGKICVIFPLIAYPSWPVNGVMLSRSLEGKLDTYPQSIFEEYQISHLGELFAHPQGEKELKRFAEQARNLTLSEAELGLKVCKDYDWDLFFMYFSWLDTIEHHFWRYYDESDPAYPGITSYKDVIRDFYKIFDKIVGDFMNLHPDATTIVFSDHGHGMRPPKTVNINEFLREKGLLSSKASKLNPVPYLIEILKRKLLDFTHKYNLIHLVVNLGKKKIFSSMSKGIYMSTSSIDLDRTVAYLSSFAGPKSYPHGGIEIKRENLKGMEYEELRSLLIEELGQLKEPDTGEKLMEWICRREELYSGPFISSCYPDIVFELKEGYGVYWGIHTPLIGTAYEHKLASGGHHKDAVFLISNLKNKECTGRGMTLMDVAPTILDLLDIGGDAKFDGESIFKNIS